MFDVSTVSYSRKIAVFFTLYILLLSPFFFIPLKINWGLYRWKSCRLFCKIKFWNIRSFLAFRWRLLRFQCWILTPNIACSIALFMSVIDKVLVTLINFLQAQNTFIFAFITLWCFAINIIYQLISFKFIIFNIWKEFRTIISQIYFQLLIGGFRVLSFFKQLYFIHDL